MCSGGDGAALPTPGCPIRESTGQRLFSASPWLIAAVHALLRLLVPRHPPYALTILTVTGHPHGRPGDLAIFGQLCSFQGPERGRTGHCPAGLSKLNSMQPRAQPTAIRVRSTFLGPPAALPRRRAPGLELPRKEVIQPHLPVRLPCYDFTPITSPTFDGSLPGGLGHRLRVLPAFVV